VRRQLDLWSGDGHLTPNGKDTLSDVTGVHGISARMQFDDYFPLRVDEALVTRAAQKCRKYQRGVEQLGCNFTPLVFETISGRVSPALEAFVASRNAIIADRTGVPFAQVAHYSATQLSCILRKQFVHTILARADRLLLRRFPRSRAQDQYTNMIQRVQVFVDRGASGGD